MKESEFESLGSKKSLIIKPGKEKCQVLVC
jgi:hypothetical protein